MIKIVCPNCQFSKEVAEERISPRAIWATCPQCRTRFQFRQAEAGPSPASAPIQAIGETKRERAASPWERRAELGFWGGARQTFKSVLFSPKEFFKNTVVEGGIKDPLAFGLLTGSLGIMLEMFWQFLLMGDSIAFLGETFFGPYATTGVFLGIMALCPLFVLAGILITSLVVHVLLLVVRGGGNGLEATLRVTSFSQATQVLGVIPFVGGLIAAVWFLVVQFIGLKEMHETSYLRVALALMIPLLFVLVLIMTILALALF